MQLITPIEVFLTKFFFPISSSVTLKFKSKETYKTHFT